MELGILNFNHIHPLIAYYKHKIFWEPTKIRVNKTFNHSKTGENTTNPTL